MSGASLFPFGHGLSYTKFEYSNLRIEARGDEGPFEISFDVANIGEKEGDEVAQLYVQDPVASVARPVKELKGFRRVTLKPRERKAIIFSLTPDDLAFLDTDMRRIVEPGEFRIIVGGSSEDIRLQASLNIKRRIVAETKCVKVKADRTVVSREPFTVTVRLRNRGPISDVVPIRVFTGNEEMARKSIDISPGEMREAKIRAVLRGKGRKEIVIGLPKPTKSLTITVHGKGGAKTRK
ncbi:MAG: fibronectin type III-like domain-contianing protein [Thermoproteota archaeon]